ncbi:MAG: sulfatase-like hydrolase/transferase [Spirochaetia bacterium]|nr:sulfatase-like hydrolase/transferase [Spirochaetia bacterium]
MSRPNILLITSDQHHHSALGFVNAEVRTPHLDALAGSGTVFARAYCPDPTCTPSRSSMITGKYPSQHGAWSLGTKLSESEPTLGAYLQNEGYRTALAGKAHFQPLQSTNEYPSLEAYPILQDLEYWKNFRGPYYGFEKIALARSHGDEAHVGQHYALWMEEQGFHSWRDHFRKPTGHAQTQHGAWSLPEKFHSNRFIAEQTKSWMNEFSVNGDQPFFIWASFFDPHPPFLAPAPWNGMYDPSKLTLPDISPGEHDKNPPHLQMTQTSKPSFADYSEPRGHHVHGFHSHLQSRESRAENLALYYGMVSLLDKYVGDILCHLKKIGLEDETLVVFTSDHGHFFGQHGLHSIGAFHYEDLIRVPMIARLPGRIPAEKHSSALQSHVDLAPTFLDFAGAKIPASMSGVSQKSVWSGEWESARDHAIVEFHHQPTTLHLRTYVDERYKITIYQNRDYGELFDLEMDPGEISNLWDIPTYAPLKQKLLLSLLSADLSRVPMWMPRVYGS